MLCRCLGTVRKEIMSAELGAAGSVGNTSNRYVIWLAGLITSSNSIVWNLFLFVDTYIFQLQMG